MKMFVTKERIVCAFEKLFDNADSYNGHYLKEEDGLKYIIYFDYDMILSLTVLKTYERLFGTSNIVVHYHKDMISVVIKPEGVQI